MSASDGIPRRDQTVLVVDDEPGNLKVLSDLLSPNIGVLIARDGHEAIQKAEYAHPDLILLDVLMPGIDGYEVCRRLKENEATRDTPIIFMSALIETRDKVKAFDLGALDYITKPFQQEEIVARVSTHLRLRKLTGRLEEEVRARTEELTAANKSLHEEIAVRKRTEDALAWESDVNRAAAALAQALLSPASIEDISSRVLEDAQLLTQSAVGFAGQIDPETGHLVIPTFSGAVWDKCKVAEKTTVFTEFTGLWGWVLNERQPILTNAAMDDPRSTGVPAGHVPIHRFLSAPALSQGTIVGQVAVANSEHDYGERDMAVVERLANLYAIAIQRKRAEEEVEERTFDLRLANEQLTREIGEREQAEAALRESEEQYRISIECSNDGVAITDGTRIVFVNQKSVEMFGYDRPEEIVGSSIAMLIHPDDVERISEYARRRQRGEPAPDRYEFAGVRRGGEKISVEVSAARTTFMGRPVSLAMLRDNTETEILKAKLQQAQKMEAIGTLAGGIAHDFNNLLAVLKGGTELALLDVAEDSVVHENLSMVLKAAERASDLVQKMLTFGRRRRMERRPLKLSEVCGDAVKMLRASIPSTVEIQEGLDPDSGCVEADPTEIHQILMNLGSNAADAMGAEGGTLRIALQDRELTADDVRTEPGLAPGPHLHLSVSDTGEGIRPDVLGQVFDPYFSTKETGKGSGLGLAVVHGIVSSLGGSIGVQSEVGTGTSFDVYIPRVEAEELRADEEEETPIRGGGERILFVDDEISVMKVEKQMLERLGYAVVSASSGMEALKIFEVEPHAFDLIITDHAMPKMTGVMLAKEITGIRPEVPVVICTGLEHAMTVKEADSARIRRVLRKPLELRQLAKEIREVLDQVEG